MKFGISSMVLDLAYMRQDGFPRDHSVAKELCGNFGNVIGTGGYAPDNPN